MKDAQGSFLGILDRQMEAFIGRDGWQRSLLCGLLFEKHLFAPDIFFFISSYLQNHLQSFPSGDSLFEVALRRGLIVPAFRVNTGSFIEVLQEIQKEGILGVQDGAADVARRLDAVFQQQSSFAPLNFDVDLGEGYENFSRRTLMGESLPEVLQEDSAAREAWEISKPWRFDLLDAACRQTEMEVGGGLRRGNWMCQVGWSLGWPREKKVHDITLVLNSISDVKTRWAAELFFRWMNECYQANFALSLQVVPNFPASVSKFAIVPYSLLSPGSNEAREQREQEEIDLTVALPPPHMLAQVPVDTLLAIREEVGSDYLSALEKWRLRDSGMSAEKVETLLEQYASQLRLRCSKEVPNPETRLELKLKRWSGILDQEMLQHALDFASLIKPALVPFIVVTKLGFSIYRWLDHRPENVHVVIPRQSVNLVSPALPTLRR